MSPFSDNAAEYSLAWSHNENIEVSGAPEVLWERFYIFNIWSRLRVPYQWHDHGSQALVVRIAKNFMLSRQQAWQK